PVFRIAHVFWKKHLNRRPGLREFCQRSRDKPGTGRVKNFEFFTEYSRYGFLDLLCPGHIGLSADTVVDDRTKKWVSRCCGKSIVAYIPIHVMLVTQKCVNRQALKRKDALVIEQFRQAGGQENVHIEIDAS